MWQSYLEQNAGWNCKEFQIRGIFLQEVWQVKIIKMFLNPFFRSPSACQDVLALFSPSNNHTAADSTRVLEQHHDVIPLVPPLIWTLGPESAIWIVSWTKSSKEAVVAVSLGSSRSGQRRGTMNQLLSSYFVRKFLFPRKTSGSPQRRWLNL